MKRRWRSEEDQIIKDMISQNYTCEEIAQVLDRTTRSVQHRFSNLNLSKPEIKIGDKINRLIVIEKYNKYEHGQNKTYVKCLCECGKEIDAKLTAIKSAHVKSCGCLRNELVKERIIKRNTTHGKADLKNNRLYRIWCAMRSRCRDINYPQFKNYGGRGISICQEWDDYLNFESWALSNAYSDELTIDRINVDSNYEPNNCRWVDRKVQAENRRNSIRIKNISITAFGETKLIDDWLNDYRCTIKSKTTLCYRLGSGWIPEDAISKPSERK